MGTDWTDNRKNLMLFSGRAHPELAEAVATNLGVKVTPQTARNFANGEIFVRFDESVRGCDAFVLQSHPAPLNQWVMEQLIMIDALKRASAKRITVVSPFYPYGRQDKKHAGREPISARLVADLYKTAGADRLMSVDLHAEQIQGFFNVPVDHLLGASILAKYINEKKMEDLIVVSPDLGGVTRGRDLADRVGAPIAIIEKKRPQPGVAKVMNLIGNVEGKNCIIIDDIVDTAGSLVEGAKALKEFGAKSVMACVTHTVLTDPACERIANSNIKELIVTNTISLPPEHKLPKITSLSVAPLLGEAIMRIFHDVSVSNLFDK